MPTTIAVFDLDGTLLDTLDDLHMAVNRALTRAGFPPRTRDEVRRFVGNGVGRLIHLAVPSGTDEAITQAVLRDFLSIYTAVFVEAQDVKTAPYPGILPLLDELRARGIRVAVVSNKFDYATKSLCAYFFGDRIKVAIGEQEEKGIRKKPAPDTVFAALTALGVSRDDLAASAVYIGDSDVDIETARNAGIPCISVTWGFRDADFLLAHGAQCLVNAPEELLQYF